MKFGAIATRGYRLTVYVGEVAAYCCPETTDYGELEGRHPAPMGKNALRLRYGSKEEAKTALSQLAECAIGMAEHIDEWWEE